MKKVVIYCLLLLVCVGVSCSKTEQGQGGKPSFQQHTGVSELLWFIKREEGLVSETVVFADFYYTMVDEAWFRDNVINTFPAFTWKHNLTKYLEYKNDCDDFARAFVFHAGQVALANDFKSSLAVANLYYNDLNIKHAINLIIVSDGQQGKKLLFFDPQNGKLMNLSEESRKYYIQYIGI